MSYWLTKITLLTCKSLVLCSFLQSSTVRANETVLLVLINHKHYVLTGQIFVIMDWLGVMLDTNTVRGQKALLLRLNPNGWHL